ncbi:MAG: sialate O-acetylesterase [Bacteroidota bacterium]
MKNIFFIFLFVATYANAQVGQTLSLPSVFSDYMVLQQNSKVPVWGKAESNTMVTVDASWMKSPITVKTDDKGNWIIKIKTLKAGYKKNSMLISTAADTININGVLFGEVWLASGQSNMQMPLKGWGSQYVEGGEEEIANANNNNIRLFQVKQTTSAVPQTNVEGEWLDANPASVENFSSVAYFFAKKLQAELDIPVGIIHSSWGGTNAKSWLSAEQLRKMEGFETKVDSLTIAYNEFQKDFKEWDSAMKFWNQYKEYDTGVNFSIYRKKNKKAIEKYEASGGSCGRIPTSYPRPEMPKKFPQFMVNTLYNAMIHPLIPYSIKGVIWYQGESNTDNPEQYSKLFPILINSWRKEWKQGDFPFYYVQIAPYDYSKWGNGEDPVALRQVQTETLDKVKNTGMVVITDVTDTTEIHPPKKKPVGERLAQMALAKSYKKTDLLYSGPVFNKAKSKNGEIVVYFKNAKGGLHLKGNKVNGFEIAEKNKEFLPAEGIIKGNTVILKNDKIEEPVYVRYNWKHTSVCNLFNSSGLPTGQFNTALK